MTRKPTAQRRGLSLIEVLLALVILVTSLAAIGQLVGIGTERATDARANTRGVRLAQAKMAEAEVGLVPVGTDASGAFEGEDGGWNYSVSWEDAGVPNLYTAIVQVSTTIQGRTIQVELRQMILDPAVVGSASQAERPPPPDTTTDPNMTGGTTP